MPGSDHPAALRTADRSTSPLGPARGPGPTGLRLGALLRGGRPRQALTKNLLVLVAPALSGSLLADGSVLLGALVALVTFAAASAAVYLVNDVRDVDSDRCHPTKCRRPVASGELPVPVALAGAGTLAAGTLGLALWWSPGLAAVLVTYLAVQAAYCTHLKHVPGLDLLCVTSGFVLRVVAGGLAAAVELSVPFVVVVGVSALFLVTGKRYSEMHTLGAAAGTRRSLAGYSLRWLRVLWVGAAAVAGAGYAVAAAGMAPAGSPAAAWALASVPLFAAGVLRYAGHVRRGAAGCPESVVFGDRVLQALGALWLVPLVVSVVVA